MFIWSRLVVVLLNIGIGISFPILSVLILVEILILILTRVRIWIVIEVIQLLGLRSWIGCHIEIYISRLVIVIEVVLLIGRIVMRYPLSSVCIVFSS